MTEQQCREFIIETRSKLQSIRSMLFDDDCDQNATFDLVDSLHTALINAENRILAEGIKDANQI